MIVESKISEGEDSADELVGLNLPIVNDTRAFLEAAAKMLDSASLVEEPPSFECLEELPLVPDLLEVVAELERQATNHEDAAKAEVQKRLVLELSQLGAKEWLARNRAAALEELERIDYVSKLDRAINQTDTHNITAKAGELTDAAVTRELAKAFKEEIDGLHPRRLKVSLVKSRDSKALRYHRIKLNDCKGNPPVHEIVSEGEHRAIALAAFLAEVRMSSSSSGIVLDDPVSSLDHEHRRRVAHRLADEAQRRQVVVFTHDLVFLSDLMSACLESGQNPCLRTVVRTRGVVGVAREEPPWDGMSVLKRVKFLKEHASGARRNNIEQEPEEYRRFAEWVYGRLREAWERTVEELLLNSTVVRYSRSVETKRLSRISDITESDYKVVSQAMSKCSTWLTGHDRPIAVSEPMPSLDEVDEDILTLEEYINELVKERKRSPR